MPADINFYVVKNVEDTSTTHGYASDVSENRFFTDISRELAFSDCYGSDVTFICWHGKRVWCDYKLSKNELDFVYCDMYKNVIWTGYFPEWEH